jgi:hypothetical protein
MSNEQIRIVYEDRLQKYRRTRRNTFVLIYAILAFVIIDSASRVSLLYPLTMSLKYARLAQAEARKVQRDPNATEHEKKAADGLITDAEGTELSVLMELGHLHLAIGLGLASMVGIYLWHLQRARVYRSNPVIMRGTIADLSNLTPMLEPICAKVGLSPSEVRVEVTRFGKLPYVAPAANKIPTLYVPKVMLDLIEGDKKKGEAVFAHELAHLIHKDLKFWPQIVFLSRYVTPYAFAFYGGMLFFGEVSNPIIHIPPIMGGLMTAVLLNRVYQTRKQSEFMADLAAAVVVGAESIRNAINELVVVGDEQSHRPREFDEPATKAERLRELGATISAIEAKATNS